MTAFAPVLLGGADLTAQLDQAQRLDVSGASAEAVKLYESILPETLSQPAVHASILKALGQLASRLGDYKTAVKRSQDAASEYHSLRDAQGEASAWNNLGVTHLYEGNYGYAEAALQQAVDLSKGNADAQAEQLSNLANVFYFQAGYREAMETYGRALDLAERNAGARWAPRRRAVVLINIATVHQRLGQDEAAMASYQKARGRGGVLKTNEEAQLLTNLGVLYRRLGDPVKALEYYGEAGRLFTQDRHMDGELTVLMNRGIVQALDLDDLAGAYKTFESARRLAQEAGSRREEMQALLFGAETLYRRGEYPQARGQFLQALAAATGLGTGEEEWKALYGLGRVALRSGDDNGALVLLERAAGKIESLREKLRLTGLKSDFFADKRDVYDALISIGLKRGDAARVFGWMERSRARVLMDRLHVEGVTDLAAFQARLDDGTAVLEYWVSRRGAAVLSVTKRGASLVPIVVDEAQVEALAAALASEGEWRARAAAVGQAVLPPGIVPTGVRRLLVVPDGALGAVPLEVLPFEGRLLVQRVAVSYLPAAGLAARATGAKAGARWPWRTVLAGFADPVFTSEGELEGATPLARLSSSAGEAKEAAAQLRGGARLYLGANNQKQKLLQLSGTVVPVIHLATHATADAENPERSRILFSPAAGGTAADYLFLKSVYDLDLHQVELVTLSACETETGKFVRGEGVQGFSRAFLAAGAASVVATLWRVADRQSAEFMGRFYRGLGDGLSKSDSLRQAKLEALRAGAHPRHWAAFVMSGDGMTPVRQEWSWWMFGGPLLAGLAGLLLVPALKRTHGNRQQESNHE
ncbi:MAG: CHAT domain-containing tetratricopeptide repeat protein [Bryobacteraceae bacterium]